MIKEVTAIVCHIHGTQAEWDSVKDFVPLVGQVIVYDKDDTYNFERFKIGDGVTTVEHLPFSDDNLRESINSQITQLGTRINELIGDKSVSQQILEAEEVKISDVEPPDENIKIWINLNGEADGLQEAFDRAIENALAQAKASGEFKGDKGDKPEKGVDYFTESEKNEFVQSVLEVLPTWNGGSY